MATAEDRRETDSGIEVKPVYTDADVAGLELEPPGEFPFTRGPYRDDVPRAAVDDPAVRGLRLGGGDERALPLPARARPDGPVGRVRPADAARLRLGRPARGRRGGADGRGDRLARRHGDPPRRDPARRGLDVDDDQRAGGAPAPALRARRGEAGRGGTELRGTVQNDILKEYVARGNYIFPPKPSMRITTDLFAYCHERLPKWNTISISGYHIREAGSTAVQELAFTLAHGIAYCEAAVAAGLSPDEFGERALVLLQRAQPLLPGGGEVPRGAHAVGADHARPVRRHEPTGAGAALPRADGRLDADRAAAGEQRRARRGAGAVGGLRRRAVDPHERVRRGARAAERAVGADRAADAADPRARGRRHRHGRSARRRLLHRGAHARARGARLGADRADRRARRGGRGDRAGLHAARDRGGGVRVRAPGRGGRARRSSASTASRRARRRTSSSTGSTPRPSGGRSSGRKRVRERARRGRGRAALARVRKRRGDANLLPPMREALAAAARSGRSATRCARSSARTTRTWRRDARGDGSSRPFSRGGAVAIRGCQAGRALDPHPFPPRRTRAYIGPRPTSGRSSTPRAASSWARSGGGSSTRGTCRSATG